MYENRFGTTKGRYYSVDYNTMVVDITHHRVYRVCESKSISKVFQELKHIPGAENVEDTVIDLSEGYRSLIRTLFPNARITADKFHVLRLLGPAINRRRKKIAGDSCTVCIELGESNEPLTKWDKGPFSGGQGSSY